MMSRGWSADARVMNVKAQMNSVDARVNIALCTSVNSDTGKGEALFIIIF
jgi:hypothetical protein